MTIQIVVMIFYFILCAIADTVVMESYGHDDYLWCANWLIISIIIEGSIGAWIARGIF